VTTHMRRIEILLPEDDYRRLRQTARERRCSVSHLVREAVAKECAEPSRRQRIAAARRLVAMRLPVGDWREMEMQIGSGGAPS
jgi:hypothetical protein